MTNKLKFGALTFVLGQIAVLWYKNKDFKDRVETTPLLKDKIKVIFNELFDLNKQMFNDMMNVDYNQKINDLNDYFDDKMFKINDMISNLKSKLNEMNESQIRPLIQKIEEEINIVKEKLQTGVNDMSERIKLEERLNYLTSKLNELKERFMKKKDSTENTDIDTTIDIKVEKKDNEPKL